MGTRSKTTVYNEADKPILSFYRQYDGYFDGHGADLVRVLKNRKIVNGYSLGDTADNTSNGMSDLAAYLLYSFKKDSLLGGIYITNHCDEQEFNYHIKYDKATQRLVLTGEGHGEVQNFVLYGDEVPHFTHICEFVYKKDDGIPEWRKIAITENSMENANYIIGYDVSENYKLKRFKVSNIVGGRDKVLFTAPS